MVKLLLFCTGLNTLAITYNSYGIFKINTYVDSMEERVRNEKANQLARIYDGLYD
jgi:hypothetical protein